MSAVRPPRTLSLMPTFRCTASCAQCGTLSNPRAEAKLDYETVLRVIDEAAAAAYSVVVFTGGEATLERRALLGGLRRAKSHGLLTRLVTNAWWAVDELAAERWLEELVGAGLDELNLSTGDQHVRFVEIENVLEAARAGLRRSLPVAVMIESRAENTITQRAIVEHPLFEELLAEIPSPAIAFHVSPWMPLSPRRTYAYDNGAAATADNVHLRTGCDSVLTTTTVQPDGRIGACCGLGMRLIPELNVATVGETTLAGADARAADDFLKLWIRVEGPERILAWAAAHDPSIEWENMYAHRCQACMRLYKDPAVREVIREHHGERVADVVLAEWVAHRFDPVRVPDGAT